MAYLTLLLSLLSRSNFIKLFITVKTSCLQAVEGLLEGLTPREEPEALGRYRDAHLRALKTLHDLRAFGPPWTIKNVTRSLVEAREEIRYNLDAFDSLLRSGFVSMPQYVTLYSCLFP